MTTKHRSFSLFAMLAPLSLQAQQLIRMSNRYYKEVQAGNKQNDQAQYQDALVIFKKVLKDCSAKDAKEEGNVGIAIASNGLTQYEEAANAANAAITATKQTNVTAYYARCFAYNKTGRTQEAKADLVKITDLTKKNKNIKARAKMFTQLAQLDFQLDILAEADTNLTKAIEIDPEYPAFYLQKGDMKMKIINYEDAFTAYDKVLNVEKTDLEIYQIRTEARLKQLRQKYVTTDIKQLSNRMTAKEKETLCTDMKKALDLGLIHLPLYLLSSLIYK